MIKNTARLLVILVLAGLAAGCGKREEPAYLQSEFIMNVPAQVKVYGADAASGKKIADSILAEWKRVSDEFSFSEPYSQTSIINKEAYGDWVKAGDEFLGLLQLSLYYYHLTDGAFDITFAPLWPIWKEAASTRKMPSGGEILKALENMGSNYVQVDQARKRVRFTKPVQINLGGILRGYCFVRAARILRESGTAYPVELRLGSNMLAYGKRPWVYSVPDPFHENKSYGTFSFDSGVVMSSSGRDHFVQIDGKLYSHILDLKTGYPIADFSNMVVYFPRLENENFLASTVLAVMGREKSFALLSKMKGSAAVWIDGQGKESVFIDKSSSAKWQKDRKLF